MGTFQAKAFQVVGSNAFTRAKKLADLYLKTNVDGKGDPLSRGYEQAIEALQSFTLEEGNVGIDAQRLVADYANKLTKLSEKKSRMSRNLGQLKLDEREIYFVNANGGRQDIIRDVPQIVSNIAESLTSHKLAVENAIENAIENNESTSDLQNYLMELDGRYRQMTELYNDSVNGELNQGELRNDYGVFVDADQGDGSVNSVGIVPIGNLPPGISKSDFKRVDSSSNYGGVFLPTYSKFTTDGLGTHKARIGSKVWSGTGDLELSYDKRNSVEKEFKNKPGDFNLGGTSLMQNPLRPGTFSKSYVGVDENGNPAEKLFYVGQDNKLYNVEDKSVFGNDSLIAKDIKNATIIDPSFAKSLLQSENIEPLRMTPMTKSVDITQSTPAPQEEPSFFGKMRKAITPKRETFFESKNIPTKPEEPTVGTSTPDIVEQGKSIFRKVGGFFNR